MAPTLINQPLALFTIFSCTLLIGWSTISDGMFFDGIVYAAVARNLAEGMGSFWHLTYTSTLHTEYYEQPPFSFFLQSILFMFLGDGLIVERIYCLVMAACMVLVIRKTWMEVVPEGAAFSWWPVWLWVSIPIVPWTYQNNLIETSMGLFAVCAVYFLILGCQRDRLGWFLLGSLFTFLASFCKGFQGLFPLVVPVFYSLAVRPNRVSKVFAQTMVLVSIPLLIYLSFLIWPDAREFYQRYFHRRLEGTFAGIQDTTRSHFYLLGKLLEQLVVPGLLLILLWLFQKRPKLVFEKNQILLFILIGCSASLPLMVTLEQRPFYLATSMPYFAIALALLSTSMLQIGPLIFSKTNQIHLKRGLIGLIVLAILALPFIYTIPKREARLVHDLEILQKQIPVYSTIQASKSILERWNHHAYFIRYAKISLDGSAGHQYYIDNDELSPLPDSCFRKINLPLRELVLFQCAQ